MQGRGQAPEYVGDEDVFVFPESWRGLVVPRRGGVAGVAPTVEPGSAARAAEVMETAMPTIQEWLTHPDSEAELVAAGRSYLDDQDRAPAMGAAVIAALVERALDSRDAKRTRHLADAWVAGRGVVFAAEAAALIAGVDNGGSGMGGRPAEPAIRTRTGGGWGYLSHWLELAGRVRAHLAVATDEQYAEAIRALDPLRSKGLGHRVATSFLLPTQESWVGTDSPAVVSSRDDYLGNVLWYSAATPWQVENLAPAPMLFVARRTASLATVLDARGPGLAPQLFTWLDTEYIDAEGQQRLLDLVAQFPTDEAMGGLIARADRKYVLGALLAAADRFPRRALKLLASADTGSGTRSQIVAELLRAHVLSHRELVDELLGSLAPDGRERVERILARNGSASQEAPAEMLPQVLVTPPWMVKRPAAKPKVFKDLAAAGEPTMVWAPGEREEWAARRSNYAQWWRLETSIETAVERYRAGNLSDHYQVTLMTTGPDELIRPLIRDWRPGREWNAGEWMPALVARYGLDALPLTLHLAKSAPASCVALLLPYASDEVASHMADTLARLKSHRRVAMAWLDRHTAAAVRSLIPAAFSKPGRARRAAEDALRHISGRQRDTLLAVAAEAYGPAVRDAVASLLATDPLTRHPARIPELPDWADPTLLPQIELRERPQQTEPGRGQASPFVLGPDAVRHLCAMLAISKPDDEYSGLQVVRDLCDQPSLADFAWALFSRWQLVGAPAKESWAMQALRWLGDDETVRRLAPVIRAWPGEGGHAKAVTGLDILAGIGSDVALMHLDGIAQKVKFKGLKERARQRIAEVAAELGLTAEQLADRLVPDLGLDADGSMTLDYGPRRFVVGFDERLKPYVADEGGARRKDLPKPGVRDDQVLAPAAYKRFGGLKKDVRTIASDQVRRLEAAMVAQRRWSREEFRDLFVAHPLLWHIVRRLLWISEAGGEATPFRVAEDRSFADVDDDPFELPERAAIGLAHPIHLGAAIAAWSQVFADYEISQPFAQLGRGVHHLTGEERVATSLIRFGDGKWPTTRLLGLERRGWQRGEIHDGGVHGRLWRATPDGRAIVIELDPGIAVGSPDFLPEQRIESIWINNAPREGWRLAGPGITLGELDEITTSEMLHDLTDVLG